MHHQPKITLFSFRQRSNLSKVCILSWPLLGGSAALGAYMHKTAMRARYLSCL